MSFSPLSAISRTPALTVTDVTARCLSTLTSVPAARAAEGFTLPSWLAAFPDKIIPQGEERIYAVDDILTPARDRIGTTVDNLFPNYVVKIFQIDRAASQLLLVAISNDLEIDPKNKYPRSLPFLIYLPPTPQDTVALHRQRFPGLYDGVPDSSVPVFYKDTTNFPFTWDFLYFQFLMNVMNSVLVGSPAQLFTLVGLPAQLKKAGQPFVLVIPMESSFQSGLGALYSADFLQGCLLGIQLSVFNDKVTVPDGVLPEIEWVTFSAFSIGNELLDKFVKSNSASSFAQQKIREYVLFDPPPNNPGNRSAIVLTLAPLVSKLNRHVLLYGEDTWYFQPLLNVISQNGISFNLTTEKIFNNSALPNIFLAYLHGSDFGPDVRAIVSDDPHAVFPALFMKDAAQRSQLKFGPVGSQKYPIYPSP